MGSLVLVTWNVLHATYGHNWDEMPMRARDYSEQARCDATMLVLRRFVEKRYGSDLLAIALQEVSGKMCARIEALCVELDGVCAQRVVDTPTLKMPRDDVPTRDTEHWMMLVFGLGAEERKHCVTKHITVASDGGGATATHLVLELPAPHDLVLAPMHLNFGARRQQQLDELVACLKACAAERAAQQRGFSAMLAGDCNCTQATLTAALERATAGVDYDVHVAAAPAPTRIGKTAFAPNSLLAAECIDHVAVFGATRWRAEPAVVRVHETDVLALSDHRPVEFIFEAQ